MFQSIFPLLCIIFLLPAAAHAEKPRAPLSVELAPVQAGLAPADIRPGDAVEFAVSVVSLSAAQEVRITITLAGGLELLSGETAWTGPLAKNDRKTMLLTVRVPQSGKGKLKVRAAVHPSADAVLAAEAEYSIGPKAIEKPAREPKVKKDSKGRKVREHRLQ